MSNKNTNDDTATEGRAPAAGSPIPAIESAVLNIGTAISDCESARSAWVYDKWNDCTMWISNAIAQLEAARSKIYAHQESENDADQATASTKP